MKAITKKWLFVVLTLVFALSFVVGVAACDFGNNNDDDDDTTTDDKLTYSVTVTSTDSDLELTSIKAQWLKGNTAASEEIALDADGKASVELASGTYIVTLKNLPEHYTFAEGYATATTPAVTIEVVPPVMATYTVSVTAPNAIALTSIKAQWMNADDTAASGEIALNANGEASTELVEGSYYVTLKGVTSEYTFQPALVSKTSTHADIEITELPPESTTYQVTVNLPAGITLDSSVKVQVYVDSAPFGSAATIVGNKATVIAPEDGNFTLALTGLEAYDYLEQSTDNLTITVSLKQVEYKVTVETDDDSDLPSGLTVTFYDSGDNAVSGATALPLNADGEATATLLAGSYTARLNGLNEEAYSYDAAAFTMTDRENTIELHRLFLTLKPGGSDKISFEDENTIIKIFLSDCEDGKQYSISLDSDDDNFNNHNYTVKYGTATDTLGKAKVDANADSYMVITYSEDTTFFTAQADAAFSNITVSVEEYIVIDYTLTLGEDKVITPKQAGVYRLEVPQYGNYRLEVTLDGRAAPSNFSISLDEGIVIGRVIDVGGPADGDEVKTELTYEFFAEPTEGAEPLQVNVFWYDFAPEDSGLIIRITHLPDGDYMLGQETLITLENMDNSIDVKGGKFIAPMKALYSLTIRGGDRAGDGVITKDNFQVRRINGDYITSYGESLTGTFEANAREEVELAYINWIKSYTSPAEGTTNYMDIYVTIELVELRNNILNPGETVSVNSKENVPALVVLGDEVKAGKTYRLVLDVPLTLGMATWWMTYNGADYDIHVSDEAGNLNLYSEPFEVEAGENQIFVKVGQKAGTNPEYITAVSGIKVSIEEVKLTGADIVVDVPLPGVSVGTSAASADELTIGVQEGFSYTITIGVGGPGDYGKTFYVVYDGTTLTLNVSNDFAAAFTATSANTIKVYATGATTITLTLTENENALYAGNTLTDVTLGTSASSAKEIVVGVIPGSSYRITVVVGGPGDYGKTFYVVYNGTTLTLNPGNDFAGTFLATSAATIKVYASGATTISLSLAKV